MSMSYKLPRTGKPAERQRREAIGPNEIINLYGCQLPKCIQILYTFCAICYR